MVNWYKCKPHARLLCLTLLVFLVSRSNQRSFLTVSLFIFRIKITSKVGDATDKPQCCLEI